MYQQHFRLLRLVEAFLRITSFVSFVMLVGILPFSLLESSA